MILDTRLIFAILLSTTLGGALGFTTSYLVLNGQIHSLQQDLIDLRLTVIQIGTVASNMTSTMENIANTLQTGLASVSEYASKQINQVQAELESLNSTISELNSAISEIGAGEWHVAVRAPAGGGEEPPSEYDTDPFPLRGRRMQITWSMTGRSANATIRIQIHFSDGSPYRVVGSSGRYGTFVNEMAIEEPGDYFLRVFTVDAEQWSVTVMDYY
jgi:hypothetical protein